MVNKDVIIACDFGTREETLAFLDRFTAEKPYVKIGMELFYGEGPQIVREVKARGHRVFLDLKLHDIPNTVRRAMKNLAKLGVDMTANWNHRYRENMDRLKSGNLDEVSAVIKALMHRDSTRGLSNGERKMLHIAKQILVSEIVLAEDVEYPEAEGRVNAAMLLKESD